MMSFIIKVVALYCFIGVLCNNTYTQNRLIQSDKNNTASDQVFRNYTFDARRRLVSDPIIVNNFDGDNKPLLGVALISKKGSSGWVSWCTGSYVNTADGATPGIYVLTAAHCFWDRERLKVLSGPDDHRDGHWDAPVGSWRVEFGVINEALMGSSNIIQCDVEDIRIDSKFPIVSRDEKYRHDYAILKLGGEHCHPTQPFTITNWQILDFSGFIPLHFKLAGYGGTRTLRIMDHKKIKRPAIKAKRAKRFGKTLITEGECKHGDSGGPIFKKSNGHLKAVFSGANDQSSSNVKRSIKIYADVHEKINKLMRGTEGTSRLTKNCKKNGYKSGGCWSKCRKEIPTICYQDAKQQRDERKLKCHYKKKDKSKSGHRYFCDPFPNIKQCDANPADGEQCLSICVPKDRMYSCGGGRKTGKYRLKCEGNDAYRYICGAKSSHARLGFNNFMENYYDDSNGIYYDDDNEFYYDR